MEPKPSKDELKEFYRNNKQYFENLARYFHENDKEYYDEYIAPIYQDPPAELREVWATRHLTLIVGIATAIIVIGSLVMIYFSLKH